MAIHNELYALAATSEPDAAAILTKAADTSKAMLEALKEIRLGCSVAGRWVDENGTAIDDFDDPNVPPPDVPGATWEAFDGEEQDLWIASCEEIAARAITAAEADEPAPPAPLTERETRMLAALKAVLAYEDDRPGEGTRGAEIYAEADAVVAEMEGR